MTKEQIEELRRLADDLDDRRLNLAAAAGTLDDFPPPRNGLSRLLDERERLLRALRDLQSPLTEQSEGAQYVNRIGAAAAAVAFAEEAAP